MKPRPDIAWSRQLAGISLSAMMLWLFAGTVVLAAHAAAGWWVMRERPQPLEAAAEPAAIMIDLAPMAMAPAAVEEQVAPDEVDSEPAEAVEAEPVEEVELAEAVEPVTEEPVEAVEPEPVEETVETPPEEVEPVETAEAVVPDEVEPIEPVEEMVAALDPVEVPLPVMRPEPEKKPEVRQEKPKPRKKQEVKAKPKPQAPAVEKRRAQVRTQREAPRAAARQNSAGASASVSPARWQARVASHLERRKRYPSAARRQGQQGTAQVRFTIDASGNVKSVSLVRSSGVALLDEEVVALVRRASPVPAPPPGVNRTIVVPIRFSMR
ncbi:MAG: energy transducer TonB [Aquamicrobium sp.]|uniref:energy transducer TonB n=1 Tax=Aquamicrobium sp. TaxID=1872579 RepID=UPI00349E9908|nr:energy transducer TonB [Aquamicrobium sp.]